MSHAIEQNDRLVVGYTSLYGEAWHRHENCAHTEEDVPMQFVEEVFDFEVEKRPVHIPAANGEFVVVPDQYHLVDKATDTVLSYSTVRDSYEIVQNMDWLASIVGGVMASHDLKVESCGTLFNRKKSFLNTVVMEHTVKGDISPTRTRLLYTNAYDNCAMSACASQTRVVCANTLRVAQADGAANATLRKFKHTKGVATAMSEYAVDLADLVGAVKVHNEGLDHLASLSVTPKFVREYLGHLFGLKADMAEGRSKTMAENKVEAVSDLLENKDDLQGEGIRFTKYALLNAVTDWADHIMPVRGESDSMTREWNATYGVANDIKQKALSLIHA